MNSWLAMLQDTAEMFMFLAVKPSLLLMVISTGVSLIRQKVPDHKIQQIMGARKGRGYLLVTLLGAITPFCSYSTIPMLRGLLSTKAGFGPILTFLFVSPLLNPVIVGLMWMTFGWKVTLLYAIITADVSVLASITLDSLGFKHHVITSKSSSANCCALAKTSPGTTYTPIRVSCCGPAAKAIEDPIVTCCGIKAIVGINPTKLATKDALQQFKDILPYLLSGVLVGSLICGFIPSAWIAAHTRVDNPFTIPLGAVAGVPLYIRAEAVIPLASALMTEGMSLGTLVALIIGSTSASLMEMVLLRPMFRTPMIAAFLAVILGMTILIGYLTQLLF